MEKHQVELLDLILNDLGETVTQIGEEGNQRYYLGSVELPDSNQAFVSLSGKEITTFFKADAIRKTKEQLKIDLLTYMNNTGMMSIKFNSNTKWWVYAKI